MVFAGRILSSLSAQSNDFYKRNYVNNSMMVELIKYLLKLR